MNAIDESLAHVGHEGPAADDPSKLAKAEYLAIKERLSFRPDPRMLLLTLAVNHALAAFGLWLLTLGTTPAYLLAQLVLPVVFFQAFSLLHDCGHGSGASKTWSNALIGHYVSPLCFLPYFPWKFQHAQHHVWTGNMEKDPTLKVLGKWRAAKRVPLAMRIAWRAWIPVGAVLNHIVYWSYPIAVWRTGARGQLLRCTLSVAWLAACYAGLHYAWPSLFSFANFAPAVLVYLVAAEVVNLPHHADQRTTTEKLPLWEQGYSTRSCYYPRLVSELLVLNFNFHIEHHLYPTLPWYRLRSARELVKPALGAGYTESIGIHWSLEHRGADVTKVLRAS